MASIEISEFKGRIFHFSFPERFKDRKNADGEYVGVIPARELFVIAFPPGVPNEPPIVPRREGDGRGNGSTWNGWFPQCKPGLEMPWDGSTWGKISEGVLPRNFYPYCPVRFDYGNPDIRYPLGKNELFPIIKKTRTLLGRDFYGFVLLGHAAISGGFINYKYNEQYSLVGNFSTEGLGFEGYPAVDIQGSAVV